MKIDYSLYLIADLGLLSPGKLIETVNAISDSGITCVQLRMKCFDKRIFIQIANALHEILKPKDICFLLNDHVELVKETNADGAHIGQSDLSVIETRQIIGNEKILGLSIQNYQQAKQCKDANVDYFGVGPIYSTNTKLDASPAIGISELNKIATTLAKPSVAIGGIQLANIKYILNKSIAGVAIASEILKAENPKERSQQISNMIKEIKNASL